MAIAAYGTDGSIPVLTASQLDIAAKIINILKPIEEITKNISAEATSIPQVIPLVRTLAKVLEEEVEDNGICSMKSKMLSSWFDDVEDQDFLVLANTAFQSESIEKNFSQIALPVCEPSISFTHSIADTLVKSCSTNGLTDLKENG